MLRSASVLFVLALTSACDPAKGEKGDESVADTDDDGDGYGTQSGDCDDADAEVNPDAIDLVGDDIDQNCDDVDGNDADGDGWASTTSGGDDCNDSDPYLNPGATEAWYDGVDQDCSGGSDYDADADSYESADYEGDDCDDGDPDTWPGAEDAAGDDIDQDCDGSDGIDADGDGYASSETGGGDCDDADPEVNPGAGDDVGDGLDQNCDEVDGTDRDGDGVAGVDTGGADCDDTDDEIYPGAYDRPDDGVDQDCDDVDRTLDGVVLDEDKTLTETTTLAVPTYEGIDLIFLMDTTGSMGSWMNSLDAEDVAAQVEAELSGLRYGYATHDDYAYGSYGTASSGDLPFILQHQVTDDVEAVQDAVAATSKHYGGDAPESTMEALYQALTGVGYDQDCDGAYTSTEDVLPFIESASDPFGGTEVGTYDSTVSGGGSVGGMGFRANAVPVLVFVTDNYLRDPDAGYGTPGGCPGEAGAADVIDAAADLGAWVVGIAVASTPVAQMEELADTAGWLVDSDGDGTAAEYPVYQVSSTSEVNSQIAEAVLQVEAELDTTTVYGEVMLVVTEDELGLVSAIDPASYTNVDTSTTSELDFDITYGGAVAGPEATTATVTFELQGDGAVLDTFTVTVEIPPAS